MVQLFIIFEKKFQKNQKFESQIRRQIGLGTYLWYEKSILCCWLWAGL